MLLSCTRGDQSHKVCTHPLRPPDDSPRKDPHLQTYHLLFIAVATNEPISGIRLKACLSAFVSPSSKKLK